MELFHCRSIFYFQASKWPTPRKNEKRSTFSATPSLGLIIRWDKIENLFSSHRIERKVFDFPNWKELIISLLVQAITHFKKHAANRMKLYLSEFFSKEKHNEIFRSCFSVQSRGRIRSEQRFWESAQVKLCSNDFDGILIVSLLFSVISIMSFKLIVQKIGGRFSRKSFPQPWSRTESKIFSFFSLNVRSLFLDALISVFSRKIGFDFLSNFWIQVKLNVRVFVFYSSFPLQDIQLPSANKEEIQKNLENFIINVKKTKIFRRKNSFSFRICRRDSNRSKLDGRRFRITKRFSLTAIRW